MKESRAARAYLSNLRHSDSHNSQYTIVCAMRVWESSAQPQAGGRLDGSGLRAYTYHWQACAALLRRVGLSTPEYQY